MAGAKKKPTQSDAATGGIVTSGTLSHDYFSRRNVVVAACTILLILMVGLATYLLSGNRISLWGFGVGKNDKVLNDKDGLLALEGKLVKKATDKEISAKEHRQILRQQANVQSLNGNCSATLETIEHLKTAYPNSINHRDYLTEANCLHKLNKNEAALSALDKAKELLPAKDNYEDGYVRSVSEKYIDDLRQEYGK